MSKKVVVDQSNVTAGQMKEFWRQVGIKQIDQDYFQNFLDHKLAMPNPYLRLISEGEDLVIAKQDGSRVIANANETFSFVDKNFNNLEFNQPDNPTPETFVEVHETIRDGILAQLFGSLIVFDDVKKLCLTQSQIISFVENYREWLGKHDCSTFFLFESYEHLFVIRVYYFGVGRLRVEILRFGYPTFWHSYNHSRIVTPI